MRTGRNLCVKAYIVQEDHRQFGGLHHSDLDAAKFLAEHWGIEVDALRKAPRWTPAAAMGAFIELYTIYAACGKRRPYDLEHALAHARRRRGRAPVAQSAVGLVVWLLARPL